MPASYSAPTKKQNELRDLRDESNKITSESANRTREMLRLMNDCKDAGVNTLQNLYDQGEKLTRAEGVLDDTEVELDKAGIRLQNIQRKEKVHLCCFPCIACCCTKDPDKVIQTKRIRPTKDKKINRILGDLSNKSPDEDSLTILNGNIPTEHESKIATQKGLISSPSSVTKQATEKKTRFFEKILDTPEEEEIEHNLSQVSKGLHTLKDIAKSMTVEVVEQNEQIDRMTDKADTNLSKLDKVSKHTTQLIKDDKQSCSPCCCCTIS